MNITTSITDIFTVPNEWAIAEGRRRHAPPLDVDAALGEGKRHLGGNHQ
jgi:hypothetical protein